jgi:hypothetical protein
MKLFIKLALLFLLMTGTIFNSKAQNYAVKGMVLDTAGLPLPGAVVRVKWGTDSLGISAGTDGSFSLSSIKSKQFTLSAAFIGFQTFVKQYLIEKGNTLDVAAIKLLPESNTLNAVVISGVPPVKVSEDTVSFNAAAFPVRPGDAVDEVLKKLPGIKVDKDGNVTNQGVPVTKIKVNGKDFFGTDVATAIKNLPADIIKNLQFVDDYGDQAKLTGIKTGEPEKILNLTIQEDKKKGYFARASGGVGNSDRYNTSLRGNSMNGERQLSFDGTASNSNTRGGGGDGLTTRNAAGANYKNEWGTKWSADAGYNFENAKNNTISSTLTQSLLGDSAHVYTRYEDANNNNLNTRYNHEFNGNVEYKIDTMNYLKISPGFSYNTNAGVSSGGSKIRQEMLTTNRDSKSLSNSNSLNARTNVFFNHKFQKRGRNFTFWGNINYSNGDNFRDGTNNYVNDDNGVNSEIFQNQLNDQNNHNVGTNAGGSYMEPLWKKTFVEFNYNWNRSVTSSAKDTRDVKDGEEVFNPDLSNSYRYQFVTNRIGMNYRFIDDKLNYTLGLNAQPTLLTGQDLNRDINTSKSTFNLIPSARFSYKFSKQESFDMNYWGRSNQPGFYQLQPISDNSNLQNIVTGNPNLNSEFIHSLNAHYKQSDWNLGHILFVNASFNKTNDKIVTTKMQTEGSVNQITSYTNTDGFYNASADYYYSKPFAERKFSVGYSGWGQLNNNVTFIDNNKNISKNAVWRQEIEFKIDLQDIVNVEFETSYSQNKTTYDQSNFEDRKTSRMQYEINGRNYFFKDLTLGYEFSKTVNYGFDNSFVKNPTILHLSLEYRLLKNDLGTIRMDGYDLFNENSGISRDSFDNVIVDRSVNRLGRYFMLSFIYKIRKFGG